MPETLSVQQSTHLGVDTNRSTSPRAESFLSIGTNHTNTGLVMDKSGYDERVLGGLDDLPREGTLERPLDYTLNPRFKFCFLGLCLYIFLFALDAFIITSAVPQLINEFNSADELAFLNSAFFIPCSGFICLYTQFMTIVKPKIVYLGCCLIFLGGCAICGAASSMTMLIIGRAVAGLGGGGLWSATYVIGGELIPLPKRPALYGLFGLVFLVASVGGPVLGGAFTDMSEHGWRWCFYISLPIGGAALPLLFFTMPPGQPMLPFSGQRDPRAAWVRILRMDWVGAILCIGWVTCLGISLQWAGVTKAWNDRAVIVMLTLAPVIFLAFVGWSIWLGDRAMLPIKMLRSRHLWGGLCVSFFGYGVVVIALYYLSIYFQAVKGKTATKGGVLLLGLQLAMCPTIVVVSKIVERTGHMWPSMPIGSALMAIGCGLFYTFSPSTSIAKVIGYQILAGIGIGATLNVMTVIVQADYATRPIIEPHATNLLNWFGFVGRIVGITIATNIFENKLKRSLNHTGYMSESEVNAVLTSPGSVTLLPNDEQAAVIELYNDSINYVWIVCIFFSLCSFFSTFLLKRLNMLDIKAQIESDIVLSPLDSNSKQTDSQSTTPRY